MCGPPKNSSSFQISLLVDGLDSKWIWFSQGSQGIGGFSEHKILVVKEEADTLQFYQTYYKEVAKADKRHHWNFLDGIWCHYTMVGQMELVIISNAALNKVQPRQWSDSHN